MCGLLHGQTCEWLYKLYDKPQRQVWHNFRETRLTYEKSYLARLPYVHENAVKHRLVPVANQYPWCSAAWFERTATPAQVKTLQAFKTDRLQVYDEYTPDSAWQYGVRRQSGAATALSLKTGRRSQGLGCRGAKPKRGRRCALPPHSIARLAVRSLPRRRRCE